MYPEHLEEAFKQLDTRCYNCNGTGQVAKVGPDRHIHDRDCDVCYGTGFQPTRAGIELLNFLRRQRKRIEREKV